MRYFIIFFTLLKNSTIGQGFCSTIGQGFCGWSSESFPNRKEVLDHIKKNSILPGITFDIALTNILEVNKEDYDSWGA